MQQIRNQQQYRKPILFLNISQVYADMQITSSRNPDVAEQRMFKQLIFTNELVGAQCTNRFVLSVYGQCNNIYARELRNILES